MKEIFGSLGIQVIGFLVACLLVVLGVVWNGLLGKMDSMNRKLDKVVTVVYEEKTFVRVDYLEKDLKPWIRGLEVKVHELMKKINP